MILYMLPEALQYVFVKFSTPCSNFCRSFHFTKQGPWLKSEVTYKVLSSVFSTSLILSKKIRHRSDIYNVTPVSPQVARHIFGCFEHNKQIQKEAELHGITKSLFRRSLGKFKQNVYSSKTTFLSMKINHILHGIERKEYELNALLPLFLDESNILYPTIKLHHKMKHISDLSEPTLWYPKARSMTREIIFHAGPTNSGKTHSALERFLEVDSAVYCSPLRLLAREVCQKSRDREVPCDMITGDDRDFMFGNNSRANKVACTVEMTNLNKQYDVAIIDEIQMLSDMERGWAWTRAFLGVCATEIHVCGEERALHIIKKLAADCGEHVSVCKYKRLGQLKVKKKAVETLDKLQPGDCIVCFSKQEIYNYKQRLEEEGIEAAIIYGYLPPQTKIEQAKKFNDPHHPCNILITTDAIGMGLNLNIKRIIFNSLTKMSPQKGGGHRMIQLTTSHALQIAGRAGRFGSQYSDGAVTVMHSKHAGILHKLLGKKASDIKTAGLHPSYEKIEEFARAMKTTSLCDVLSVFISMCETDKSLYFLCSLQECQDIAEALKDIKMSLQDMYTFCLSPISPRREFVLRVMLVFANYYADGFKVSSDDVKCIFKWPPKPAKNKQHLADLEDIHECLRLYLWLSYRFPDVFVDSNEVKLMRKSVDYIMQHSVSLNDTARDLVQQTDWEDLEEFLLEK